MNTHPGRTGSLDTWWEGDGAPRNLADIVVRNAERVPEKVVISRREGRDWLPVTAAELERAVSEVAKGLIAAGVRAGDRVGLMAKTRYEWTLCDLAIWAAGAVTVPVYDSSSADQLAWILGNSGATACILENSAHAAKLAEIRDQLPDLAHHWLIDGNGADSEHQLAALVAGGNSIDDAELFERRDALTRDCLATVIYTSGTTGRPKGCELTHGNFLDECTNAVGTLPEVFEGEASTLLFIPLAHVFGRMVQVAVLLTTALMAHSDVGRLTADLPVVRPTFLLGVPRVFERVFERARRNAAKRGKEKIFDRAVDTAIAYSKAIESGRPSPLLRGRRAVFDRLVYGKLRAAMGGQVRWAISGGAPLGARLAHFFRGAGVTVLEGYGLTETTAAAAVNRPRRTRVGTVGPAVKGFQIAIADDGEVLLKGGHVFHRYWRDEAATKEVLTADGWFHTGDLGQLDRDGFLSITGRKKEILVTSGGKNVSPAQLEDVVRAHPLVSQCLVLGDGQDWIGALITLDEEALSAWLGDNGRPETPVAELVEDAALLADLRTAVDAANAGVSSAERIRRFRVLPTDFTENAGHVTPTLKLRRTAIMADYASEIDALYSTRK